MRAIAQIGPRFVFSEPVGASPPRLSGTCRQQVNAHRHLVNQWRIHDQRSRQPRIVSVGGHTPQIDPEAFVAAGATLVGDVHVKKGASVFYGCVLRAEAAPITIGEDSNVQDNTVMHTDAGKPVVIGARVSIGHQALVHGAIVDDDVLIGMHSTVLNDAHIGSESLVAAGAVVLEGTQIPARSLVAGVPAKVRRR